MMSIEVVKRQIKLFLSTEKPEVIAIKGAWGVGKTYSWKKFLLDAKQSNSISLERYSYVSLFGINSLDALKYAIFENAVKRETIGIDANLESFKDNAAGLLEGFGRKSMMVFKDTSLLKSFSTAIESLSFMSLNKSIICIDDLERRGSNLAIKDVLGLVSQLKEQKGCKIALLLNDNESGLDEFNKYREKVIDIELQFSPTAKECSEIAYEPTNQQTELLPMFTEKLNIRNIRILKKIERLVMLASPLIQGFEPEIKQQVSHSLVLFSWCFYSSAEGAPPIEMVTNLGYSSWGIGDKKEESEEIKKWKSDINEYGYQLTDAFDLVLANAVKTGFFIEDEFDYAAKIANKQFIASKSDGSYTKAWNLYHDSFDDNKDDVINNLYENFKINVLQVSLLNLNGTVNLFKELGESSKATELIDYYIEKRKSETQLFNLDESNVFGDVLDAEIIEKFKIVYAEVEVSETAIQVLKRISGNSGWNQKDEIVLVNTSVDEYFHIFKNEKSEQLSSLIRTCLKFGQFSNSTDQQKQIAQLAINALKRIATESPLNRLRVKKFGIEIDE